MKLPAIMTRRTTSPLPKTVSSRRTGERPRFRVAYSKGNNFIDYLSYTALKQDAMSVRASRSAGSLLQEVSMGFVLVQELRVFRPKSISKCQILVDGEDRLILIRGIRPEAFLVHDQVSIITGHAPRNGRNELLVGKLAAQTLGYNEAADAIGKKVMLDDDAYTISGVLEAGGGIAEGEMWTSLTDLQITAQRNTLSCIIVSLDQAKASDLDMFAASRIDLELAAISEDDYFAALSQFYKPIEMMVVMTCIMIAIGGMLGGFNSTYAAFASRVREVGTLQTLGYKRSAIALSLVQESILSASIGAIIACVISMLVLDGFTVRFSMGILH